MSTWTCKVRLLALALPLAAGLSGCIGLTAAGTTSTASEPGGPDAAAAADQFAAELVLNGASLFGGAVILRPPQGYCVDGDSLRARGGAFALIAACPLLLGAPDPRVPPLVMTVSGQAHDGPLPDAAALAALMAPARVLSALDADGLAMVHLEGGAPGPLADGDPRHWRAVMSVNGHLLSLALFAPQGARLAGPAGEQMIRQLAEGIRAATAARPRPPAAPAASSGVTSSSGPVTGPAPAPENTADKALNQRGRPFARLSLSPATG